MERDSIVAVFVWPKKKLQMDVEIPLDISANELIVGLNQAFRLGMDVSDLSRCHLKAENPIALLRGNKPLRDFRLRNGTLIQFVG